MRTPFFGGFSAGRSSNLNDCQLINLYPEIVENQDGKDIGGFYMAPGRRLIAPVGTGPVRGMFALPGAPATMLVVSGSLIYSVNTSFQKTLLGNIGSNAGPVSIISNGPQSLIVDGTAGYLVNANAVSPAALNAPGPVVAAYQDGFGFVNQAGTNQFWQTNLDDFSVFDPLNFSSADANAQPIVSMADIHRQLWLLKTTTCEVWIDGGLPGFAFQRIDGVLPEIGCAAPFSVCKLGESLIWLSQNDQGAGMVHMASGYNPSRVSNHAIESVFYEYAKNSTISDAIAYTYMQEGHEFYVLTFPSADATWVFDKTASAQIGRPMWHQRAEFLNGLYHRVWDNCGCYFGGLNLVGDYRSGKIYALDLDMQTDNGAQRKWLRTWRALQKPTDTPTRFNSLRIDMESGIGVPDGTNPQAVLEWSDDGGHTWSNEHFAAVGPPGATAQRVKFNRLGSTRRNSGLDRIFRLSSTDAFNVSLIGADLE